MTDMLEANTETVYTIFAKFEELDCIEELDVAAETEAEARAEAADLLNADYMPGWEIIEADNAREATRKETP